jgi:hypothetical protein
MKGNGSLFAVASGIPRDTALRSKKTKPKLKKWQIFIGFCPGNAVAGRSRLTIKSGKVTLLEVKGARESRGWKY